MENIIYPAIFKKTKEGTYDVFFPDVDGCYSQGETLEEAFLMASDALSAYADAFGIPVPPSDIKKINADKDELVLLVKV